MQYKPTPMIGRTAAPSTDDLTMDFRARLVHQQAETAERRRSDLAEQSSRLKTAAERIRIWEPIDWSGSSRSTPDSMARKFARNSGAGPPRKNSRQISQVRSTSMMPAPRRWAITRWAAASGVNTVVSIRTSGFSGASYGESIPVKFLSSPRRAFL